MKRILPIILCLLMLLSTLETAYAAENGDLADTAAEIEELADTSAEAEELTDTGADTAEIADLGAEADDIAETGWSLLTEAQFQTKMASMRSKYPDGSVWEGVYYEDGMAKAWTCWAYAAQMMYEFFGARFYADGLMSKYQTYDLSGICAGDWVRIDWDSHSIFITKVTDAGVWYTDGNGTGISNQIRWDGFYSWSEIQSRFSYRVHLPGNDLSGTGTPVVTHAISYDANGGSGTMASYTVRAGEGFTLDENEFTRAGYTFAGYTVNRSYDNKWFCSGGAGWRSMSEINSSGYTRAVYPEGGSYKMSTNWLGSITESTTFTFYAEWEPVKHTIAYSGNGGSGSMSSSTFKANEKFTLSANEFINEDSTFTGYTVKRSYDNKWYTTDAGWQTQAEIYNNGYTYKVYPAGNTYTLGTPWLGTIPTATTFTFYAQWLPDYSVVEFMDNYSGYNYLLGTDFSDGFKSYIYSRDNGTYTLSYDASERFNNQGSLKVVGSAAGASGADLAMKTSTNNGCGDGYSQTGAQGDEKDMTLRISIKSPSDGAKFYIRWGFQTVYTSVTLSKGWKTYTISLPKNRFFGATLHPYFDKAGTYYINSASLADGSWNTGIVPERGDHAASSLTVRRGAKIGELPTPSRAGYTFLGWYTAAEDGVLVTSSTAVNESSLKLYAHWSKDVSYTPVKTVESNGHVYELYDNVMTWEDAKAFCESQGGHLVTIDGYYENNVVYQMINDRQGYCWLGLSYNTSSKNWEWVTGEPYFFNYWYHSSYPTTDSGEYYTMMYPMNLNGTPYAMMWDKVSGSSYYRSYYGYRNSFFVCEYETTAFLGDTNGDGEVESSDATVIQRHQLGLPTGLSLDVMLNGDVDKDGELEIMDATFIQRWLASVETPYPIGKRVV